jgi:catechol 2,3-dioxygenase-like lactoylglutathione lyase family enzyme
LNIDIPSGNGWQGMDESWTDGDARQAAALSDLLDLLNAGDPDAATALAARAEADGDLAGLLRIARLLAVQPDLDAIERVSATLRPWDTPVPPSVLEVTGLDHVALPVSDLDRAVEFYVGLLGLRIIAETRTPPPPTTPHVDFAAGHARVLVYQALGAGETTPRKTLSGVMQFPHVALRVSESEGVLERLSASGYPFDGPTPSGDGEAALHLWDPDGNQIDLVVPWPDGATR